MLAIITIGVLLTVSPVAFSTELPWLKDMKSEKWRANPDIWMVGANFIPSNAQNELTMFQDETFDPITIDRELRFAESLGFNAIRVFLHNILWAQGGFLSTIDTFLQLTDKHNIGVMFVLLDSCWNAYPQSGRQPDPIPYVHNSVWMQAPGIDIVNDPAKFDTLKPYITGVVSRFRNDSRIIAWDVWNEPDNSGYTPDQIAPLLSKVFDWCEESAPTQPLTSPLWRNMPWGNPSALTALEQVQVERSDIISFHSYEDIDGLMRSAESLRVYDKPLVCTEYMAREAGSTFDPNLGYLKDENICAFNWGLVSGLTQTIYPWSSGNEPNPYEGIDDPDPWFHDILHADGTPKYPDEVAYIRGLTGAAP